MLEPLNKARLKALRKLNRRKTRDEQQRFVIEGVRIIEDALRAGIEIDFVIVQDSIKTRGAEAQTRYFQLLETLGDKVFTLDARNFEEIADTQSPQGIIAICQHPALTEKDKGSEPLLVLDNLRDPGNLGTCIRSAAAFGIKRICLVEGCADAWAPKTLRASMGGLFALDGLWQEAPQAALGRALRRQHVLALDAAEGLPDFFEALPYGEPSVTIVIGGETHGLGEIWHQPEIMRVAIPQLGAVDSLNAAMAATLTTNALFRNLRQTGPSQT